MHDAILVGVNTVVMDDPRLQSTSDPPPPSTAGAISIYEDKIIECSLEFLSQPITSRSRS